jgi:dTDP-4-dehydrorhamnose 3,5-epimerase
MSFTFHALEIADVVLIRPTRHRDARGHFAELYRRSAFAAAGIDAHFVQDNFARSGAGVLRGLHFQRPPRAQGKLVQVSRGRVFDVAVDLRRDSQTRGRWVAHELSAEGGDLLWIPPGFAHGYVVVDSGADVAYRVTEEYDPALDAGVRWDDPTLAIPWPLAEPIVSDRDRALPLLADAEAAG